MNLEDCKNWRDFREFAKEQERDILKFDRTHWETAMRNPSQTGLYLTMRCGLSGIYTVIDKFDADKGQWCLNVLDSSKVIAYNPVKYKLPKELETI